MRDDMRLVALLVILSLAVGCTGKKNDGGEAADSLGQAADDMASDDRSTRVSRPTLADSSEIFRGYLVYGPERRSFKACGENRASWVVDLTRGVLWNVYEQLTVNSLDPVFVEVRGEMGPPPGEGFGADYDHQLTVLQLRRAALEGPGCNEDLKATEFRALGNEPFWSVNISERGIVFSDFGRSQELVFPYSPPQVSADRRLYAASVAQGGRHRIEITIDEQPCTDTMSGAYFSYVVQAKVDGRTYVGCAMEGWR